MGKQQVTAPENAFHYNIEHIRLGEFDLGGVLYHANYFHLYEMAREAVLASIDHPYPSFVEHNQHFAIVESHQRFFAPIQYGQALEMKLWFTNLRRSSLTFHYLINLRDTPDSPLHYAWSRSSFVQIVEKTMQIARMPEPLANALTKFAATE